MSPDSPTPFGPDRALTQRILAIAEPIAHAHGAEIVDIEYKSEQSGWVLRFLVEKEGSGERAALVRDAAVDLALCAEMARDLSPALDVADLIPHRYNLEVSSPGLERTLHGARDFARFAGQKAKLKLKEPVDGQKVLVGVLAPPGDVDPKTIRITIDDGRAYEISLDGIVHARLVFDFGPATKPGSRKSSKSQAKPNRKLAAPPDGPAVSDKTRTQR